MADATDGPSLVVWALGGAGTLLTAFAGALYKATHARITRVEETQRTEIAAMRAGIEQRLSEGREDRSDLRRTMADYQKQTSECLNRLSVQVAKQPTREEMLESHTRTRDETIAAIRAMMPKP